MKLILTMFLFLTTANFASAQSTECIASDASLKVIFHNLDFDTGNLPAKVLISIEGIAGALIAQYNSFDMDNASKEMGEGMYIVSGQRKDLGSNADIYTQFILMRKSFINLKNDYLMVNPKGQFGSQELLVCSYVN